MAARSASWSSKVEDRNEAVDRKAAGKSRSKDERTHIRSAKTSSTSRLDPESDATMPGHSEVQLGKLASRFRSDLPAGTLSPEAMIPGLEPGAPYFDESREPSKKLPETLERSLHKGLSRNSRMRLSTTKSEHPTQETKHDDTGSITSVFGLDSADEIAKQLGSAVEALLDQNEKLARKLQSRGGASSHETVQDLHAPPRLHHGVVKTTETALAALENLTESNRQLERKLGENEKELKEKAALLWQQDYDLRDYKTKTEQLTAQLAKCMTIDDLDISDVWAKTPLEEIQEQQLKAFGRRNRDLERRVRDLEEEVRNLKGTQGTLPGNTGQELRIKNTT